MMTQDVNDDFSKLWQRHLSAMRDEFSTASLQALPSVPSGGRSLPGEDAPIDETEDYGHHVWENKINWVVDTLEELTLQSPRTTGTHSPGTSWFPDREGYTETALSSPENSSWPKTVKAASNPIIPQLVVADYSDIPTSHNPKGKKPDIPPDDDSGTPYLLKQQLLQGSQHTTYHIPDNLATLTITATTALHTPISPSQRAPPSQVHVLILTWAQHDRRGPDRQLLTPGLLDNETEALRACLKRRGYRVQCRLIPTDYPTAAVETLLDKFLDKSEEDTLLVVYYHGYGNLDREGRMLFLRWVLQSSYLILLRF